MRVGLRELGRFIVVGCLAVVLDASVYAFFYPLVGITFSKALSFIVGTSLAYTLNNYWTFSHGQHSHDVVIRFIVLYLFSLGVNVFVNKVGIGLFGDMRAAFVVATGLSAAMNFAGQKLWVFGSARERY